MRCVLLLLCCFPQTQTWVPPLNNPFLSRIRPHSLSTKIRECDGVLLARLDSNEYYFSILTPASPFPSRWKNGGVIRGNLHPFYLLVQVTAEMNYPLVSQSCIKQFLICPTAAVTTQKPLWRVVTITAPPWVVHLCDQELHECAIFYRSGYLFLNIATILNM